VAAAEKKAARLLRCPHRRSLIALLRCPAYALQRRIPGRSRSESAIEWEVSGESNLYAHVVDTPGLCIHCVDRRHHSVICSGITSERPRSGEVSKRATPHQEKSYEAAGRALCLRRLFVQRLRLLRAHKLDLQQSWRIAPTPGYRTILFGREAENQTDLATLASSEGRPCLPQDDKRARRSRWNLYRARQLLIDDFFGWSQSSIDQGPLLLGPPLGRSHEAAGNQKTLRMTEIGND